MMDRPRSEPALYTDGRHPRILLGPSDIAPLRERAAGGVPAQVVAGLIARCDAYLEPSHERWLDPAWTREAFLQAYSRGAANSVGGPLHDLSFAWLATGDERYLARLRPLLRSLCVVPGERLWRTGPHHARYQTVDTVSRLSLNGDLSLAYDILAEALPAAEREAIAALLVDEVVLPFRRDYVANPRLYSSLLGVNPPWHELIVYAWALAAVYEPARDAGALEELADLVRRAIHRGVDDAGVIGEGPNYGIHDQFRWVSIAVILWRAGVADLWQEERFCRMLDVWGHLVLPAQGLIVNPEDTLASYGQAPVYALLMSARFAPDRETRERHHGLHRLLYDSPAKLAAGDAPASAGLLLLWERDDVPAPTPAAAGMPLDLVPSDFGVGIFRASWDDEALVACLLAAGRSPSVPIHRQLDAGHLGLYALGETFSVDPGYGDVGPEHHSVMVPEPRATERDVWIGGRVSGHASVPDAAWMQADLGAQWGCYWYHRDLILVRSPGLPTYAIVVDAANLHNDWSTHSWQLNSHADNQIQLHPAAPDDAATADRATIQGRRHRLEIAFAPPGPTEYPRPHTIRLETRSLDSHRYDGVRPGLVLGQGPRPQLLAHLEGYNGHLLTALMPRRADQSPVAVRRLAAPLQQGLALDFGDFVDTILCNPLDRRLAAHGIVGEARLAIARRDRDGRLLAWIAVDAYALRIDGHDCLPRQGRAAPLSTGRT